MNPERIFIVALVVYILGGYATGIFVANRYYTDSAPNDATGNGVLVGTIWPLYWIGFGMDKVIQNKSIYTGQKRP